MVWGYYELDVPPDRGPVISIVTFLREQGCTCTPTKLCVFSKSEPGFLCWEYSCQACQRTVSIEMDSSSAASFNLRAQS